MVNYTNYAVKKKNPILIIAGVTVIMEQAIENNTKLAIKSSISTILRRCVILTSAANILSRLKSILGLTAASLIDKS